VPSIGFTPRAGTFSAGGVFSAASPRAERLREERIAPLFGKRSVSSILKMIRSRFREVPPSMGGKEKEWIAAYTRARNKWLLERSSAAVKASAYRTKDLLKMIEDKNWNLDKLPLIANGVEVR